MGAFAVYYTFFFAVDILLIGFYFKIIPYNNYGIIELTIMLIAILLLIYSSENIDAKIYKDNIANGK